MKFFLYFLLLVSFLSLAASFATAAKTEDNLENIERLTIDDDEPGLPGTMTDPDFDDDYDLDNQKDSNLNAPSNSLEPRKCIGRCRSRTNDCVWKCSDDWSRVVKPCHEYRSCTRDRRHCQVLANAQEWATCR